MLRKFSKYNTKCTKQTDCQRLSIRQLFEADPENQFIHANHKSIEYYWVAATMLYLFLIFSVFSESFVMMT